MGMIVQCANVNCPNGSNDEPLVLLDSDYSYRYGVGISHYKLDEYLEYVRSYAQIFNTLHCCSDECAKVVTHNRIEQHTHIPFGEYAATIHNPSHEQSHATCRENVEYNQDGILPDSALPRNCFICDKSLVDEEIYIPHVDDSTNGKSLNPSWNGALGCCSLEHAQELAHKLVDKEV